MIDFANIAGRAPGLVSTRLFSVSVDLKSMEERAEDEDDNPLTLIGECCEIAVTVLRQQSVKKKHFFKVRPLHASELEAGF